MTRAFQDRIIEICDAKIAKKGDNVGLSFYAFFKNRNDNPELLLQVATWWIKKTRVKSF